MTDAVATKFSPKVILVPTDFSASANAALDMATDMARYLHAEIYLLNVVPMMQPVYEPGYPSTFLLDEEILGDARKDADRKLQACVAELGSSGIKSTYGVEIGNDVVGNIMMVIDREHIDMLVLSTHGLSGWKPLIFGSIAAQITKLVKCPMLLLHSRESAVAELPKLRAA